MAAVAQVNKAAGPFEAIFCVGRFCGAEEGAAGDLPSYVDGTATAPVPTYFVDGLPGGKCVTLPRTRARELAARRKSAEG